MASCGGSCTASCGGSCSTNCSGGCASGCSGTCLAGCSGCSGNCTGCSGSCSGSCSGTCSGNCSGGCSGGCSGCSGSCSGGCSGCSGSCSGTCTACTGTCSGTCNNACTSASASSAIANLGLNIRNQGFVSGGDFVSILNATIQEYNRRGISTAGKYTAYSSPDTANSKIFVEHASGIFYNVNTFPGSGKSYTINSSNIVKTSDLTDCIAYVQQLMSANISL